MVLLVYTNQIEGNNIGFYFSEINKSFTYVDEYHIDESQFIYEIVGYYPDMISIENTMIGLATDIFNYPDNQQLYKVIHVFTGLIQKYNTPMYILWE